MKRAILMLIVSSLIWGSAFGRGSSKGRAGGNHGGGVKKGTHLSLASKAKRASARATNGTAAKPRNPVLPIPKMH